MPTAKENLDRYEREIDWQKLVDLALADPPRPQQLADWLQHFSCDFGVVYGGPPLLPDYPDPVRAFFRRIAAAAYPPELLAWIDAYEAKHGSQPSIKDVPRRLRPLIPPGKPNGRPRADTRRWLAARRAWQAAIFTGSYEIRRELIAHVGEHMTSTFGFTPDQIKGERPHLLALEKLSSETGLSESRLQDLMGHRKQK